MGDVDGRPVATPFAERVAGLLTMWAEAVNVAAYRLSHGNFGSTINGAPVLLLTASGRRTGVRRTKPLLALRDGESWIVVASRGGAPEHPAWFLNLLAFERDPDAAHLAPPEVEVDGQPPVPVTAHVLAGAERERWWHELNRVYPRFDVYQRRAARREIPVVRLQPRQPH